MRRHFITLALQLALAGLSACQPGGAISGHAFYQGEASHSGIVISASGPQTAGTVTADDGSFVLTQLAAGRYSVTFASARTTDPFITQLVDVGQQLVSLDDVSLTLGAAISGVVVDARTHEPISLAAVVSTHGNRSALTATDGTFTLASLPLGPTTLIMSATGREAVVQQVDVTRDGLEVGEVPLREAIEAGTTPALKATVVYPDHSPASGAKVHVTPANLDVVADATGTFSVARLPPGAVSLDIVLGAYHASATNILILEGTTGLRGFGHALYPVADTPIALTLGVPLPTQWAQLAPDGRTWFGAVPENFVFGSLDDAGAPPTPLFDPREVALASVQLIDIADDSSTVAVSINATAMLASTKTRGRTLLLESGEVHKVPGNRLLLTSGLGAREETLMPFAFGAEPLSLGPRLDNEKWDWLRDRRVGVVLGKQVDVLTLQPAVHHEVLTLDSSIEVIGFSTDTNWAALRRWSWADASIVAQSLTDFTKQLKVPIPSDVSASSSFSPESSALVVWLNSAYSSTPSDLFIVDLTHEVIRRYAPAQPSFSADDQFIALVRQHLDDSLSSVALVPLDGSSPERALADDVNQVVWGTDGALWLSHDEQFATQTSVLSRFDPTTMKSVDLPRGGNANYQAAPKGRLLRFNYSQGIDLVDPDGRSRRLTSDLVGSSYATFSPDGEWVLLGVRQDATQSSDTLTAFKLDANVSTPVGPDGAFAEWVGAHDLLVSFAGAYQRTSKVSYVELR